MIISMVNRGKAKMWDKNECKFDCYFGASFIALKIALYYNTLSSVK